MVKIIGLPAFDFHPVDICGSVKLVVCLYTQYNRIFKAKLCHFALYFSMRTALLFGACSLP